MRLFGFNITREKALAPISDWKHGWRVIHEPYTGAWQKNDELKVGDLSCYPTVYACLNRIASDIGKLPFLLKREDDNGIWRTTDNPAYSPVLRKPNAYQTQGQFREAWILSKLIDGNAYILKQRDNRGVVTALYVLDPCRVTPMVSEAGRVFYQINYPTANNLLPADYPAEQLTVPASEIIHDRINPFHHHLLGVPPLCAAALAAGKNLKILRNTSTFFSNNAQPGGLITAPAGMSEEDADKIAEFFNTNFTGERSGRIGAIGADLKFTPFAFKAADSQLVEQMRYSDEQICQPFGIPPFKVGIGSIPAGLGVDAINQLYYADALQSHIEAMENLLDEGLGIARPLGVELDLEPLLRMDAGKQADLVTKLIGGKALTPDEGRAKLGYGPTGGGDTIWGQHQDYPLGVLRDRNDLTPVAPSDPEPVPEERPDDEEQRRVSAELWQLKAIQATREAINA